MLPKITDKVTIDSYSLIVQQLKLTPETTPASHIAGTTMRQNFTRCRKTGSHDGVGELDRSGQLDQGDVITRT